ncbi:MAG: hypothetical protein ACRELY_00325 [Polyangiaceae bacterium]
MKLRMVRVSAMTMVIIFGSAACVRTVPPPAAPPQELPKSVANVPPEVEGEGRVVVDVTNGPARVDEVLAQAASATSQGVVAYGEITRNVCLKTPCAVNLDYGQHNFRFVSTADDQHYSEAVVDAGRGDTIFRHTMGEHTSGGAVHAIGGISAVLGGVGLLTGATLLGTGVLIHSAATSDDPNSGSGLTTVGAVTTGVSAALLALGIGLMVASPATNQEGASTEFAADDAKQGESKRAADSQNNL